MILWCPAWAEPTNPQTDIVGTGCSEYWITDVNLMKHRGNDNGFPSDDPIPPEVCTATEACIYNVYGKCKEQPHRAPQHYTKGFRKEKYKIQWLTCQTFTRPPCVLLRSKWASSHAKILSPSDIQAKWLRKSISRMLPPTLSSPYQIKAHFHGCYFPTLSPSYKNGP